jgi:plastocyanin
MSTLRDEPTTTEPDDIEIRGPWTRLLVWTTAVGAVADAAVMLIEREPIPPLVLGIALTGVGMVLLRRRPRAGVWMLGVVALLLALSGAPFALPNVSHPDSPVSFIHAVITLVIRPVSVVAAVCALRSVGPTQARRLGMVALAGVGAAAVMGLAASATTTSDAPRDGDVRVRVHRADFPEVVQVGSGAALLVENGDFVHHNLTVEQTAVSSDLPARKSVRVPLDLEDGRYRIYCDVLGHEAMEAELIVG